tara:strand:- start:331 stop:627 length:297 start_codon:yes stop_codon:yes gene_type:complete
MKTTYKLTTGNGVNEMKIHSTFTDNLEFTNLEDAEKAFNKEVECLQETYTNQKDVDYPIDQVKESEQCRTRVDLITFDEDGYVEDIETVLESESFIVE